MAAQRGPILWTSAVRGLKGVGPTEWPVAVLVPVPLSSRLLLTGHPGRPGHHNYKPFQQPPLVFSTLMLPGFRLEPFLLARVCRFHILWAVVWEKRWWLRRRGVDSFFLKHEKPWHLESPMLR